MSRPTSILVATTAQELRDFLPEPMLSEIKNLTDNFRHLATESLSEAEFHQALAATNPEILISCWKTPALPETLPSNLRYVCYLAGSIKKQIQRHHIEKGLIVTNWGGSISRIVAEWALFHTLSCLRRATHWTLEMHRAGGWKQSTTETASLFGRRVGLHGFGQIARELVKLLQPFGCEISAFAPDVDATTEQRYGIKASSSLEALFSENDIIIELAPLIPATTGIVTESLLRRIRPGGVFVNVGRGAVVDEAALLRVAKEGKIQIGLDVFGIEPLPIDSEFRGLVNVTLTPHLAGPTTDRRQDAGAFALQNILAYVHEKPMQAVITTEVFDVST